MRDQLEPGAAGECFNGDDVNRAIVSIAISLRRLADMMERPTIDGMMVDGPTLTEALHALQKFNEEGRRG